MSGPFHSHFTQRQKPPERRWTGVCVSSVQVCVPLTQQLEARILLGANLPRLPAIARKQYEQRPILGNKGWLEAEMQPDPECAVSSASSLLPDAGWEQK